MKTKLIVAVLLVLAMQTYGQETYECHTVKEGSKILEFQMKIIVTDSEVKFELPSKPTTSYKKLPSSLWT